MTISLLIVVPTLNSHTLLPRLVCSLQQQTWSQWRLLFIDGPSCPEHRHWLLQCCSADPRCHWVEQDRDYPGIFGAMNQGFDLADPDDWLLFLGSDDWAATPDVLAEVFVLLELTSIGDFFPDLIVCRGRYFTHASAPPRRLTCFHPFGLLTTSDYRRTLFLGSTPPHQATLFGPGARQRLNHYNTHFRLSADLDFFLKLSQHKDLCVQCFDLELVHMLSGGVSGVQTRRRLLEVFRAYRLSFGLSCFFPFFMRYVRRVFSRLPSWT